jgi:peroxiredoxin
LKRVLVYAVVLFMAASILGCFSFGGHAHTSGKPAPNFTLKEVKTGQPITLSHYKGKVVILDFWATWCPPCRAEIPHWIALYNQYKSSGLVIIGVSMDDSATPVKPFMDEYHVDYPVVMGDNKVANEYGGIEGIPTTFIINQKGDIVKQVVGYRSSGKFDKIIKKLLM